MAASSYIFGGDTGETPESLKRKRAIAQALFQGASQTPKNVGEGLSAIGQALLYRAATNKADKAEKQLAGTQSGIWAALTGGDGFDGFSKAAGGTPSAGFPSAPAVPGGSQASNSTAPTEVTSGIRETAAALGIDPVDLGTAISYETAGTFDPTKAGPTTQWGQHKGLIQFGEPQAEKYGVDWSNPVGSQLGSDGAVAKYLRDTGVKPGMGLLDIYSAINAGGVGRYGASDADNGGAPGNVRDKVEQQMAGHRAKAVALLGALEPGGAASAIDRQMAPTQVASADPNFMPEEPTRMPPIAAALNGAPVQPMPPAQTVGANPVPPNAMPMAAGSSKVANALAGMSPEVQQAAAADPSFDGFSQNTGFGPAPATGGGMPDRQALMGVLSNPWASDEQRQFATMMLQQQMKANAPPDRDDILAQQRFEYERQQDAETQAYQRSRDATADARAGRPQITSIYDEQGREQKGYFGPDNQFVPLGGAKADPSSNGVTVMPDGTVQVGGSGMKLTEGQSKDVNYYTRGIAALDTLNEVETALTAGGDKLLSGIPGVGNYMIGERYQKADQAGREFLASLLRKDTGAAVTADEMSLYGKTYLPQPGDGPEVLEQKKASRKLALEAMKIGLGNAAAIVPPAPERPATDFKTKYGLE